MTDDETPDPDLPRIVEDLGAARGLRDLKRMERHEAVAWVIGQLDAMTRERQPGVTEVYSTTFTVTDGPTGQSITWYRCGGCDRWNEGSPEARTIVCAGCGLDVIVR